MALSLIGFTLRDTRTHISILNGSNILSNIEAVVNNSLDFGTTLWIPDVDPNDSWIRVRGSLDNVRLGHKNNIIEDICVLKYFLD